MHPYLIIDLISLEQITWGLLQKPKRITCTLGTDKAGKKPKLGQQFKDKEVALSLVEEEWLSPGVLDDKKKKVKNFL